MTTIKNVRSGILVIPDAGLKLQPGETVSIEKHTDQINSCLKKGHLISIEADTAEDNTAEKNNKPENIDLSKLNASEAISKVNEETDPDKLKGYMETEKRRTVLDALKNRLEEVDIDAS